TIIELCRRVPTDSLRRKDQSTAAGLRRDLRLARPFQEVQLVERFGDRAARGKQAVVAQDQGTMRPEIADQALPFLELERDSLIVVVAEMTVELQRMLADRQQAFLLAGDGNARGRVGMGDAEQVMPGSMHG